MAVLPAAARLLDEFTFAGFADLAYGFTEGYLRLADRSIDTEFAPHAFHQYFQMQLAHAGNDGLARFVIGFYPERRIFLGQAAKRNAHFFLVDLGLGLHRLRDHGIREHHLFQRNDVARIAQGISGASFLEADRSGDVASVHFADFGAVVGMHLQHAADSFLFAFIRIEHRVTGNQYA